MTVRSIVDLTHQINTILRHLFEGHGVEASQESGCVRFPAHPGLWVNGALFQCNEGVVQLDVRLGGFDGDRVLVESVAGPGENLEAQARFAMQSFANASFHVLLPAFFGQPPCHGTEREIWTIGGRPRVVYVGPATSVFGFPPSRSNETPDLDFFPAFVGRLETVDLPPGVHWVRLYQMRHGGGSPCNEVLLDNAPWSEMRDFLAGYPWPIAENRYDVRVFFVVKDP